MRAGTVLPVPATASGVERITKSPACVATVIVRKGARGPPAAAADWTAWVRNSSGSNRRTSYDADAANGGGAGRITNTSATASRTTPRKMPNRKTKQPRTPDHSSWAGVIIARYNRPSEARTHYEP